MCSRDSGCVKWPMWPTWQVWRPRVDATSGRLPCSFSIPHVFPHVFGFESTGQVWRPSIDRISAFVRKGQAASPSLALETVAALQVCPWLCSMIPMPLQTLAVYNTTHDTSEGSHCLKCWIIYAPFCVLWWYVYAKSLQDSV